MVCPLSFTSIFGLLLVLVLLRLLDFLNHGLTPPKFNSYSSYSQCQKSHQVNECHPISLCNVVYKLASKILANRLRKILPPIISETQSAFVHGKLITDNVLVAFETMHHISQKREDKVGEVSLKLDMSKAYDRVERVWLKKIMEKLGFSGRWRSLV